ncbi:MAG: hypothetical protein V3T30_06565, partial [Thermodesulfobacteriota bacterium]
TADIYAGGTAGGLVNIGGLTQVVATAANHAASGSGATANANLYVNATGTCTSVNNCSAASSIGDVTIVGTIAVVGVATNNAKSGQADGGAFAALYGSSTIDLQSNVFLLGIAGNYGSGTGSGATANASFIASDYAVSGSGVVNIDGNLSVLANANNFAPSGSANADATAVLRGRGSAGGLVNIDGSVDVTATALNSASMSVSFLANAGARLLVNANSACAGDVGLCAPATLIGDVTVVGPVSVSADAANMGFVGSASALANAAFYGSSTIDLLGDITVVGNGLINGAFGSARGLANFIASDFSGGVNIGGNLTLDADAVFTGGLGRAVAAARSWVNAGTDITYGGDATLTAMATNNASSGYAPVLGQAFLINSAGGNISMAGNLTVSGFASNSASGSGPLPVAQGAASYKAGADITLMGSQTVSATAYNLASNGSGAIALTFFTASASGGAITVADNLTVTAVAEQVASSLGGNGSAFALASASFNAASSISIQGTQNLIDANARNDAFSTNNANAWANFWAWNSSGDITIDGDLSIGAFANSVGSGIGIGAIASAFASAYIDAAGNFTMTGDLLTMADASNTATLGSSAWAFAYNMVLAGGDISIKGDPEVFAFATLGSAGLGSAYANAWGSYIAGGNLTIDTDPVIVDARAMNFGTAATGGAWAYADLYIYAGVPSTASAMPLGNTLIDGMVDVWASAFTVKGDAWASAYGDITGATDLTMTGGPFRTVAIATTLGTSSPSTAFATADAHFTAGLDPFFGGYLTVGDAIILASANAVDSTHESANAFGGFYTTGASADYMTFLGAAPIANAPTAYYQAYVSGIDTVGPYYAELEIVNQLAGSYWGYLFARIQSTLEENEKLPGPPYYPGREPFSLDSSGWVSWAGAIGRTPIPGEGNAIPAFCDRVVNGQCLPPQGN